MNKSSVLAAVLISMFVVVPAARSASLTLVFNSEFSGAQAPQGPTPWLTATFDDAADSIGANGVRLTLSTTNLVSSEFVSQWLFNFSGDASQLSFTPIDNSAAPTVNSTPVASINGYSDAGTGNYDILFDFQTAAGAGRFTSGETVVYDIQYTSPLGVADFNVPSTGGGNGAFVSAAQIQGISDPGCPASDPTCGSGWVGSVPIPAAVWLFGSGLLGLVGISRRKKAS